MFKNMVNNKFTYLVTGGSGYIGHHLLKMLPSNTINIDIKHGNDILDCNLPDADLVIHLAAQPGVIQSMEDPTETVRTNTLGTVRLAEKYKDTKFIFASTGGAIQDEIISPYGLSKYCAEEFVKMLFNDYVILRFANVYGKEGSRSVIDKFIKEDDIIIYGDGSQTRTFVHIDDLIRGIIDSMNWPKGTYYFGSDQNYTVLELAKATGKPIGFTGWVKGELKHSSLKNTTLGWEPKINAIEYIKSNCKKYDE
jgi:UDP-glucose 4-epimerase